MRLFEQLVSEQCVPRTRRQRGQSLGRAGLPRTRRSPFSSVEKSRRGGTGGACTARRRQAVPQASLVSVPTPPVSLSASCPSCSYHLCHVPLVAPPRPAGARSPRRGQLAHTLAQLVAEERGGPACPVSAPCWVAQGARRSLGGGGFMMAWSHPTGKCPYHSPAEALELGASSWGPRSPSALGSSHTSYRPRPTFFTQLSLCDSHPGAGATHGLLHLFPAGALGPCWEVGEPLTNHVVFACV